MARRGHPDQNQKRGNDNDAHQSAGAQETLLLTLDTFDQFRHHRQSWVLFLEQLRFLLQLSKGRLTTVETVMDL